MADRPQTKKEFYRELHRWLGRKQAERDHHAQKKNLVVSSRGEVTTESEGTQEDWRSKVQDLRSSLDRSRTRARGRGRAFAR